MENYGAGAVCLILVLCCAVPSLGTVYTVGDSAGWSLSVDYGTWATGKTFNVGDTLVFNYGSSHTVDEVSSSDYSTCTVGNSIATYNSGPTSIALNTTGTHYFICGVIGHCSGGMKLAVPVTAGGGGGGGGGGGSTTPPSLTPPSGTSVPMPSSSTTVSPFVPALFIWVAALFKLVLS